MYIAIAVIAAIVVCSLLVVTVYNGLVTRRNRYKNAYAQIDVQLKRRYDLIPNLVEAVRGYLKHEAGTLEAVVQARNTALGAAQRAADRAGDPEALRSLVNAEAALNSGLVRVLALSESYPQLAANQNVRELTEELTTTENRVAFARQAYNDCVTSYNTARETFPAVVLANSFGFETAGLLEAIDHAEERQAPRVAL
ncbi:MAG TPA: LemA family protein [Polyangiales bacterium]|nr:LemA family protein [Polyangiales bacterium]